MEPQINGELWPRYNQNIPISLKFPTDTATMVMKLAALEMSQKIVKMQKQQ